LGIVSSGSLGCLNNFSPDVCKDYIRNVMKEIELKILGMTCEHCVRTVKNALYSVEGVSEVDVSLQGQSAKVKVEDHVSFESLKSAVESWGYKVVDEV
jgi:copper chaperone